MFSERVRTVMERKRLLTAPPEITVSKAAAVWSPAGTFTRNRWPVETESCVSAGVVIARGIKG